jgi:hypothetical protein
MYAIGNMAAKSSSLLGNGDTNSRIILPMFVRCNKCPRKTLVVNVDVLWQMLKGFTEKL